MIHCWLKAYLNFGGCQQTGRWFDLPRGPGLLLSLPPPRRRCCSVRGNRSSLWPYESLCLCAALALLPPSAKGLACLWEHLTAFPVPAWTAAAGFGSGPGVKASLGCGLFLQQLQKALIPLTLPVLGRQVVPASQKLQINSMLEEHTWPANSSEQVG